jgi:hypothetical protein
MLEVEILLEEKLGSYQQGFAQGERQKFKFCLRTEREKQSCNVTILQR